MNKRYLALIISLCLAPGAFAKHKGEVNCSDANNAKAAACSAAAIAKAARIKAAKARMARMKKAPAKMDHSTMDHSKMEGMDHSNMKGMDHSKMTQKKNDPAATAKAARIKAAKARMAKMKKNAPAKMDHSKMSGMDHSNMKGMDHSKMTGMDHSKMKPKIPISDGSMAENIPLPFPGALHMVDDPLVSKLMFDALEIGRNKEGTNTLTLEGDAWLGYDLHKLWIKTDLEMSGGELEEGELQLLYSRGVSAYWDVQAGVRKDFKPVGREFAVLGLKGTAPYMLDVDTSIAVGRGGQINARFNAEYELMLTQKAFLAPELDLSFYSEDDEAVGVGSGLSQAKVGFKLGYEIKREFAPYIGVRWAKKFGNTADFARAEGEEVSDTQLVLGIEAWF